MSESLLALRERRRALESAWAFIPLGAVGVVAVPWYLHILEIDLPPLAWSVVAYLAALALASAAMRRTRRARGVLLYSYALQASGIALLAFLWHLAGGLGTPMFLLAFVLPVVAAGIVLRRWLPYASALLSSSLVGLVALMESPELGWYLLQLGLPMGALVRVLPTLPREASSSPADAFVLVETFALLSLSAAVLSTALGAFLSRLNDRNALSRSSQEMACLSRQVLESAPWPAVLVFADTGQVVRGSRAFLRQMLFRPQDLEEKGLFELLQFQDADGVRSLLRTGGDEAFCIYRVGPEARIAGLHVESVLHDGEPYAYVVWRDLSEETQLRRALETLDEPTLLLGSDGTLRHANRAAEGRGFRQGQHIDVQGRAFHVRTIAFHPSWAPETMTIARLVSSERSAETLVGASHA